MDPNPQYVKLLINLFVTIIELPLPPTYRGLSAVSRNSLDTADKPRYLGGKPRYVGGISRGR